MRYLIIFLLAACTVTPAHANGRAFPYADAVTFLGTEGAAKQLKKAVFAVQLQGNIQNQDKSDDWLLIGSGFFVAGANSVVVSVTCHHVVAKPLREGTQVFVGIDTENGYVRAPVKVVQLDAVNDIAILVPHRTGNDQWKFQNLTFSENLFDDDGSLVEGRGVMIPGYPLALGVEDDKNHPVIRLGMIAQFTGKSYFLIDGVASHGNSGSPVFALNYENYKLVGMVTSYHTDRITLLDEKGQLAAQLPYNSGIARAVKMQVIADVLKNAVGSY
jgi:S1-C subfamily serine protease